MTPVHRSIRATAAVAAVAVIVSAISSAHAAGQVDVDFVDPTQFADAGFGSHQRGVNLKVLGDHLVKVASARLPTGQTLKVDVLDVQLAGIARPEIGSGQIRVVRGGADWPRIKLRYSLLAADGQVLQSGTDDLTDLGYLRRIGTITETGPLPYEKRLLDDWLDARFPVAVPNKG